MYESLDVDCPICGGKLQGRHCKLVCGQCGYREDCSDLFEHAPGQPSCPADTHALPQQRSGRPSTDPTR